MLDPTSDFNEEDSADMVLPSRIISFRFYENRKGRKEQQLVNAFRLYLSINMCKVLLIYMYIGW